MTKTREAEVKERDYVINEYIDFEHFAGIENWGFALFFYWGATR
jgi:hypothetical protein